MKPNTVSEYYVFLASPGDVNEEREAVREFFKSFNKSIGHRLKVRFEVIDWENYSNIGVGRPQELITSQTLEKFKDSLALVVGIMAQRFGSPTGTHESGTEEEFEWAYNSNSETGFPEIKWFFKNIENFQSPADISEIEYALEQWKKVEAFKDKLRKSDPPVFYGSYSDISDFKENLRNNLSLWLNDSARPWFEGIEKEVEKAAELNIADLSLDYYQSLEQTYKSLDIRGIDNDKAVDIPLSEVYVRLRVIRDENVETDEEDQDFGELDIHDALSRFKRLVIVGDPGSGKSTFLKFIALILAQSKIADDSSIALTKLSLSEPLPIPFFVSLWDLSDFIKVNKVAESEAVPKFIVHRLADFGIEISDEELEKILKSGNCCLLFDGLDEVPTEQGRALISRLLEKFVTDFPENRFVVTSRVRGYTGDTILKNEFVRCDIQDFDENDRIEFLKNWFAALFRVDKEEVLKEGTKSNTEFTELQSSVEIKDRIRALAVNPLLMTVIAIVHWNRKRLPDQRVDLYDECVDVLLGQRKTAERTGQSKATEILDETREEDIQYDRTWTRKRFGEIALLILQSGEEEETTRDSVINLLVPRFLDRGAENRERAEYQAEAFLDNQELKSGLLVSRRTKSCRFVHLTFQEYLAAWNLANQSIEDVKKIISEKLREPHWFETLQLLGGELAKNSDEKLDEYISYLLDNIGDEIAEQAPIIALCANVLSDVKGVANIKADTKERYTIALKGTLDTFQPDSLVPPKTQLEVLNALAQLGASVKEHLIQATKSSYFQVRSEALKMLIVHLSNDDLFGMKHMLGDKSQEPRAVYLSALFERDKERTKDILSKKRHFISRDIKPLSIILENYLEDFNDDEILEIVKKSVSNFNEYNSHFRAIIKTIFYRKGIQENLKNSLMQYVQEETYGWNAMDLLAYAYPKDESVWKLISLIAISEKETHSQWNALYLINKSPDKFTESWDKINEIAFNGKDKSLISMAFRTLSNKFQGKDFWQMLSQVAIENERKIVRQTAFQMLVEKYVDYYWRIESKILSCDLDGTTPFIDPRIPISKTWIKICAMKFSEDESKMRERFEKLAKVLPITIEK